jgi:hypothetical protein
MRRGNEAILLWMPGTACLRKEKERTKTRTGISRLDEYPADIAVAE